MGPRVRSLPGVLIEMRPVISGYLAHTVMPATWYTRPPRCRGGNVWYTHRTRPFTTLHFYPICGISTYIRKQRKPVIIICCQWLAKIFEHLSRDFSCEYITIYALYESFRNFVNIDEKRMKKTTMDEWKKWQKSVSVD